MTHPFSGIWPAMFTPLTDDGAPNLPMVDRLVELFVRQRLGGLYVIGSTGQWPLLALDQRKALAERIVKAASGKIPIIVHVGAAATDDAVALAKHAAKIGADGVSAVAPIYYGFGPDAIFEHYRRIGAASDLPLYVYHLSVVNQVSIGPRQYAERVLALPNIAGMKITDRDLYQFGVLHAHAGERLRLFSGADEVMCHAALSGAIGAIGTFYNVWGPACAAARAAFVRGDVAAGTKFMLAFQDVIDRVLAGGNHWAFLRAAMRLRYDLDIGPPRAPLGMLDKPWASADVEKLVAQVDAAAPPVSAA